MPFATVGQTRIYYRLEGNPGRPLLVMSHSLGADHGQWDPQVPALLPHFQVLRYDTRGHGASDAPAGDYTMEQLGRDVLGVVDAAGGKQFAFCGLSLGGMIGQWLGAHAGDRVTHLVLANTSPKLADPRIFEERRKTVLGTGMATLADAAIGRFFLPRTVERGLPAVATIRNVLLSTNPAGYAGCCAAIRDMDFLPALDRISAPVLVVAGDHDVSLSWSGHGEILAARIRGAQFVHLPTAHLSNVEQPSSFNSALLGFLLAGSAADPFAAGMAMRRAMLGDAYVDRALLNTTPLTRDFQELIARYAWGTVWTRPGLDPRTRRLLVLAITAALGCWDEFRLHVSAGLEHELEPVDLKELLLQTAIYAGVPAANTGFRIASEEWGSL